MKKIVLLLILSLPIFNFAQVGIGTTTPDTSAILEVSSITKGVLTPRVTSAQRIAIGTPAQSLLVYDTDANMYYYYSSANTAWTALNVGNIKTISATSYTLTASDSGRILDFTSDNPIALTIPSGILPIGFQASITQSGNGSITINNDSGAMVVNNRWGGKSTQGKWSKAGIEVRAINSCVISGDLQ